jgi:hypothetical protein
MMNGNPVRKKRFIWGIRVVIVFVVFLVFRLFDPYQYHFYPKCAFHELTGYKCPGCGSQRAIHYLFNFDIIDAFNENALLVLSIPYIFVWFYYKIWSQKFDRQLALIKFLFGKKALKLMLAIVIAFWLLRNTV